MSFLKTPINLDPGGSALNNAYHLARVARATYSSRPEDEFPELKDSFECLRTFWNPRIFGLIVGNGTNVVVAFRGTHEDREWVEGLTYGLTPWVGGRAHKGFVRLLDGVWQQVLAGLYDARAHERRLWVTGHSVGGALATLAGLRLEHEGFDVQAVYTFGAPPVVDAQAAEAFRCTVYRVVNNEDAIPAFSWPTLFDTYAHAGERLFLTASGAVGSKRYPPRLARRIDRAMSIGEGIVPAGPWHDHSLDAYLSKLERHASN